MSQDGLKIKERVLEVKQELAERCSQDSSFRESLLSDPNGTIEAEYELESGSLAKENVAVEVVVEGPGKLVVPIPPDLSDMDLSDEQLEMVSGGEFFVGAALIGAGATLIGVAADTTQRTRAGRRW